MAQAPKTATSPADAPVDKSAKFVELASKRVTAALDKISVIGNLANKSSYDFNADQVKKIEAALHAAVDVEIKKFADALAGKKVTAATAFTL